MTYLITEEAPQVFESEMIDLMVEHMVAPPEAAAGFCATMERTSVQGGVYPMAIAIPFLPSFSRVHRAFQRIANAVSPNLRVEGKKS